ncbi:glycerophosphodiester phosphodiesterase [Photobacterium minamisatsumaniensis]|uniref:glycerophosphodiester phosphodiesterase n=1 Tax=Photobacterium minamisatsumaniensis TaxID=2910233 RepID=UPI003D11A72A
MIKSQIASHRGGTLVWGENCRRAFENTLRLPVELVEFDVHPTKDGVVVVHHDATLDRTTDMTGPVNDKTWQELAKGSVNYSGGQRIMTLEELCELYRSSDIIMRLEIKADVNKVPYAGLVDSVLQVLQRTGMISKTIISSFNCEVLAELAEKAPTMFTIWLMAKNSPRLLGTDIMIDLAQSLCVNEVSVHVTQLDKQTKRAVEASELKYGCYGAHTAELIQTALDHGVHAFTTDRPDMAIKLRDAFMLETKS